MITTNTHIDTHNPRYYGTVMSMPMMFIVMSMMMMSIYLYSEVSTWMDPQSYLTATATTPMTLHDVSCECKYHAADKSL